MYKYVILADAILDGYATKGYIRGYDSRRDRLSLSYTKAKAKLFDDEYEAKHYYNYLFDRCHALRSVQLIRVSR